MESKPLTFGELEVGDKFIDFPTDGDDGGHGGFRNGSYVFQKMNIHHPLPTIHKSSTIEIPLENAFRIVDGNRSYFPDSMQVYKIIF